MTTQRGPVRRVTEFGGVSFPLFPLFVKCYHGRSEAAGTQILVKVRTGPGKAARSEASLGHQMKSGSILFLAAGKLAA